MQGMVWSRTQCIDLPTQAIIINNRAVGDCRPIHPSHNYERVGGSQTFDQARQHSRTATEGDCASQAPQGFSASREVPSGVDLVCIVQGQGRKALASTITPACSPQAVQSLPHGLHARTPGPLGSRGSARQTTPHHILCHWGRVGGSWARSLDATLPLICEVVARVWWPPPPLPSLLLLHCQQLTTPTQDALMGRTLSHFSGT